MAKPKTREQIEFENRKNIFKLGALVFAVLVVVAIIGWIIEAPKTAKINVLVAPTDAKVTIGGKKFNNGTHRIEPGTYDVEITRDEFEGYSGQITVEKGKTGRLYVCLEKTEGNSEYYDTHERDYQTCYTVQEYLSEQKDKEKYTDPIYSVAPYHNYNKGFYIDPYAEDDGTIKIQMTLITCNEERAEGLKQNAIEWLQGKGIKTDDYEFIYKSCAYGDE